MGSRLLSPRREQPEFRLRGLREEELRSSAATFRRWLGRARHATAPRTVSSVDLLVFFLLVPFLLVLVSSSGLRATVGLQSSSLSLSLGWGEAPCPLLVD